MFLNNFENVKKMIEDLDSVDLYCNVSSFGSSLYLYSLDLGTELYLKYNFKSLIISRVQFKNTRQGIMTSVLQELIIIARKYNLEKIIVQSVLTKEMSDFCMKNNFKHVPCCFSGDYSYIGDYELDLY